MPIYRASANLFGENAENGPGGIVIFRQWSPSDAVMVTINATGFTSENMPFTFTLTVI